MSPHQTLRSGRVSRSKLYPDLWLRAYEDIEQEKHLKVVDHLGNRYKSKAAMAEAYGISKFVFDKREKAGWSLEKALTTPTDTKKQPIDRMKRTNA